MRIFRSWLPCALVLLAGCPAGDGAVGASCGGAGDCDGDLQCVAHTCAPKCAHATDCGDGYSCDANGNCQAATGEPGDACTSEVDCGVGLSCQLDGSAVTSTGALAASCTPELDGHADGDTCAADSECRNGTCALGHCVDLCTNDRDCGDGDACMQVPRVEASTPTTSAMFGGCLPAHGILQWSIPVTSPSAQVYLPVPSAARSVTLVMTIDGVGEQVGASAVRAPGVPTPALFTLGNALIAPPQASFYAQPVRHLPAAPQAVLTLPSTPDSPLVAGAYGIDVQSFRTANGITQVGSSTPTLTAIAKLDASVILDLHFFFLDLDDHPCAAQLGNTFHAADAEATSSAFQSSFLSEVKTVFARGGIALGSITYDDVPDHPDLDGLELTDAASLLALGSYNVGINVFFVRTLAPSGLQAFGPNPGPAGLAGTPGSGVVVALDSLCYRSWTDLGRLTVHELARYMGLYDNVELDGVGHDPISDDDAGDPTTNLMFYSELGGIDVSAEQSNILSRSAVLR